MTSYPFFKKIIHSFYKKDLYIFSCINEKNKIGFKYLFFLISIFWIPEMVKMQIGIHDYINNEFPSIVDKLPVITIKNGVASFDKPSPYAIKDEETGKDIMIFDESGTYTSLDSVEAKILLTDTKLIYEKSAMETREYSLATINDFTLTHEKILSWAGWGNYLTLLFYLIIVPSAFLYRAFLVLIYSLIGLIFQAILGTKYSFQTLYRLCIIAITPAYIIDKLLGYFEITFTGWSFICLLISLAYLYFGLIANKEHETVNQLPSSEFGTNN